MRPSDWHPTISADGKALDGDGLVGLTVLQDTAAPGTFELRVEAWNERAQAYRYLDTLTEGATIKIVARDRSGQSRADRSLFVGQLTALELDIGGDRSSGGRRAALRLRGYDARHLLMRARRTRTFQDSTDSEAVRKIAGELGLSLGGADSRVRHPFLFQADQTDYDFIRERGAAIGFELVAGEAGLEFRPPPLKARPVATLDAGDNVLDLQAAISIKSQVDAAQVRGWDVKKKEPFVGRTGGDDPPAFGGRITGPARAKNAFGAATTDLCDVPVDTLAEAEQRARAALRELALSHITAQVVAAGDPALVAGSVVTLAKFGERLSGDYYAATATHEFDLVLRTYHTSLSLRRIAS